MAPASRPVEVEVGSTKDLQMGMFCGDDIRHGSVESTRCRQRLIHRRREPVSTANDSYPHNPQETVNADEESRNAEWPPRGGEGYTERVLAELLSRG